MIRLALLRFALAAVGIGAIAALGCAQSASPPRGDNQVWTDTQLAIPLNKTTDFVLIGVVRFGRNVSRPVNERIGAGISTKLGKYLTVFPFYLHIAAQPTSTSHNTEERVTLEATAKFPVRKFTITDRNRIEFHFHSPPPNFTQYRNRLMISHAIRLWHTNFEGFAADEVSMTRSPTHGSATVFIWVVEKRLIRISHSNCITLGKTTVIRTPAIFTLSALV